MRFLSRRVHLITGKGGVGRTTLTAALAKAAAAHGRRTLVCDVSDPDVGRSALGAALGAALDAHPRPLAPNLWGARLISEEGHRGFLRSVLPKALVNGALRSKAIHRFLAGAPSFYEMGIMYHLLTWLRAEAPDGAPMYEVIVVDMPATGHALAFTSLPEILLRLMPKGPIARALREGQGYLNDPQRAAAWVVTLPEKLPVSEALELVEGLAQTQMPVGGVLINRMPVDPFTPSEHEALDEHFEAAVHGRLSVSRIRQAAHAVTRFCGVEAHSVPEVDDVALLDAFFQPHLE
ncbi:arsenic transporter [Myxococcota bacterium]|nr:arsenic transporter [Myxococcota bacterium]MBU1432873.1 arsenic transporter [Myxococcota bacterium]MBU1898578.1 arsenic transporter [Myxococcota bacterium]